MTLIQQVAAAIAKANGDDYAKVPLDKVRWARAGGMFDGVYRDINQPMQLDYDEMAEAAIRALADAVSDSLVDDDKDLPTAADVRGILVAAVCGCHACRQERGELGESMMVLCPECGNKRCPKASDHRMACTGSNEPGQPGSVYA